MGGKPNSANDPKQIFGRALFTFIYFGASGEGEIVGPADADCCCRAAQSRDVGAANGWTPARRKSPTSETGRGRGYITPCFSLRNSGTAHLNDTANPIGGGQRTSDPHRDVNVGTKYFDLGTKPQNQHWGIKVPPTARFP
jgi:hypothetical protein